MSAYAHDWTRSLEKKLCDRVQIVLSDPPLRKVLEAFGPEVFRRSSVFHGLDRFLRTCGAGGKTCFEIGTWNGLTAAVLSRYFDTVVTVDIVSNPMKHRVLELLGIDNVFTIDVEDNDHKRRVAETYKFDFAYLDGDHAHDTEADFALVRRCGRVLFHEVWPFQPPVWRLVQGLPQDEVTYGGDGLALWQQRN